MKFLIVFAVFVVAAFAAPPSKTDDPRTATILRQNTDNIGTDGYSFDFETSDGTSRQEQAQLKELAPDVHALQVRGSVEWFVEGVKYQLNYVADENGFRPEGAHLPVA